MVILSITVLTSAVPRCENLQSNENITIIHNNIPLAGTTATYSCIRGELSGVTQRMCLCDGIWSLPVPTCMTPEGRDNVTLCEVWILTNTTVTVNYQCYSHKK